MARYTEHDRALIDKTVLDWRERCLLADESLLLDGHPDTWTEAHLDELYGRFTGNPIEGDAAGGTFDSKWAAQLSGSSDSLKLLAAEVLLIHFLFASSVGYEQKLAVIANSLNGSELELPVDTDPVRAMKESIGNPGIGFNTRRDLQVGYLIDFALRLKRLPVEAREHLLSSSWELRDFADDTHRPVREMRHILLHLLRPDDFERISSGSHKREIAEAFSGLVDGDPPDDLDERLFAIRQRLSEYLPAGNTGTRGELDFYHPPLQGVWQSAPSGEGDRTSDLEALEWKKQIVLYGPPGTSKTFQANLIAQTLIRRAAIQRWGAKRFFENPNAVEKALVDNVFWVQLHPGYGYEQFIRGLRLEGDVTRYQPGYLPYVVQQLEEQQLPDNLPPLPGVLVLDEINRTNLSEMLGEAFSLLERDQRGKTLELPGYDRGQVPDKLRIPEDLYVIGTMNEIDQSVETLDFALRRRFLWRECPFERDTLLAIIAHRWRDDVQRYSVNDAADQLDRFADRAEALNQAIGRSPELGPQYQIGHAYFADIAFFIGPWARARKAKPPNGTFLWTNAGRPQPPLEDLWDRAIRPLLQQYLSGSDAKAEEMKAFSTAFFGTKP